MIDSKRLEEHMNNGAIEYVMCAAIHVDDGKDHLYQPYNIATGIVFCGWRHPSIFSQIAESTLVRARSREIQGFLTTKNRFLTRDEALLLVKENCQLTKPLIGGVLTSEDLW